MVPLHCLNNYVIWRYCWNPSVFPFDRSCGNNELYKTFYLDVRSWKWKHSEIRYRCNKNNLNSKKKHWFSFNLFFAAWTNKQIVWLIYCIKRNKRAGWGDLMGTDIQVSVCLSDIVWTGRFYRLSVGYMQATRSSPQCCHLELFQLMLIKVFFMPVCMNFSAWVCSVGIFRVLFQESLVVKLFFYCHTIRQHLITLYFCTFLY